MGEVKGGGGGELEMICNGGMGVGKWRGVRRVEGFFIR